MARMIYSTFLQALYKLAENIRYMDIHGAYQFPELFDSTPFQRECMYNVYAGEFSLDEFSLSLYNHHVFMTLYDPF